MRTVLPVLALRRTASSARLANSTSFSNASSSLSRVPSHTVPHHTPCAPKASAATIWLPRAIPPAASTATSSPQASTTCGTSTMVAMSPVCPPASVPCATITCTPAALWRAACCPLPHIAPIMTLRSRSSATTSGGGEPNALTTSLIWGCASATRSSRRAPSGVILPRPSTISRSTRARSSGGNCGTPASPRILSMKARCSAGISFSRSSVLRSASLS